jgi:hypothetical protein
MRLIKKKNAQCSQQALKWCGWVNSGREIRTLHHCTADRTVLVSPPCTHTYMRTSFTHAHNYDQLVYTHPTHTEFTHTHTPLPPFTHAHTYAPYTPHTQSYLVCLRFPVALGTSAGAPCPDPGSCCPHTQGLQALTLKKENRKM